MQYGQMELQPHIVLCFSSILYQLQNTAKYTSVLKQSLSLDYLLKMYFDGSRMNAVGVY